MDHNAQRRSRPQDERVPPWGIYVFESHHAADFHMDWRRHAFVKVLVVASGSGTVWIGQAAHACRAGDVLVVPAGQRNRIEDAPAAPLSLYVLCVRPGVWAMEPQLGGALPAGAVALHEQAAQRVRELMRRMLYLQTTTQPGARAHLAGLALQALAILAGFETRSNKAKDDPHVMMRQYIRELSQRFYEVDSIDTEAGRLGISRRRFTQLFREATGRTWLAYTQRLRIDHARRLLAETDRTVSSIAFECGFGDLSNFYRVFNRFEKFSPLDYRRAAAGGVQCNRR